MTRASRALAGLLAGALLLAVSGCGNQQERYCKALKQDQSKVDEMLGSGSPDALLNGLPLLTQLADRAPDDLTDEWQTFLNAIEGLRDALSRAHLKAADVQGGKIPDRVQGQQRRDLVAAADRLAAEDVIDAARGIETQARDVCKINLGM